MSQQQKIASDAWLDRGMGLLSLGLVLAISYSLANLSWMFLNGPKATVVGVVEPMLAERGANKVVSTIDVASIGQWHLFGEVGKQAVKPVVTDKEVKAPETSLSLTLNGVFRAEKPEESSAIVAEQGRDGLLYRIGDRLPGNATLETVYEDRIILNRGGNLETLKFPKDPGANLSGFGAVDQSAYSAAQSEYMSSMDSGRQIISNPQSRLGKMVNRGRMPTPTELVDNINADAQEDPIAALKELGFEVVPMDQGGGYKVGAAAPMEMLQSIGLRQEDKVLSLNGQRLGDIDKDKYMVEQLAQNCQGDVSVEIERGPRRFTVNVPCMMQ